MKSLQRSMGLSRVFSFSKSGFHNSFFAGHQGHGNGVHQDIEEEESGGSYENLMTRLENMTVASPRSGALKEILKVLVNEEEAQWLADYPYRNRTEKQLAKYYGMTLDEIHARIDDFGKRGLLFEYNDEKGRRHAYFPDLVIGFFEFICMRDRSLELPMHELDRLFTQYCLESGMQEEVYGDKDTQLMRTFVREDVLTEEQIVQIMDYESVKQTVALADLIGVQYCTCKHMYFVGDAGVNQTKEYLEKKEFEGYLETCLSFNGVAESLIRNGIAREIDQSEAMDIINRCIEYGMVQTADNSKATAFLCNCDPDTCKFLGGFSRGEEKEVFQTSNFIASYEEESCVTCLKCVKKCPMGCFEYNRKEKSIVLDNEYCLGCGVCAGFCESDAISMMRREKEVFVPRDFIGRIVRTAYNRNKLHMVLFPDPKKSSHRIGRRIVKFNEHSWVYKKLKSIDFVNSFIARIVTFVGSRMIIEGPWDNAKKYKK